MGDITGRHTSHTTCAMAVTQTRRRAGLIIRDLATPPRPRLLMLLLLVCTTQAATQAATASQATPRRWRLLLGPQGESAQQAGPASGSVSPNPSGQHPIHMSSKKIFASPPPPSPLLAQQGQQLTKSQVTTKGAAAAVAAVAGEAASGQTPPHPPQRLSSKRMYLPPSPPASSTASGVRQHGGGGMVAGAALGGAGGSSEQLDGAALASAADLEAARGDALNSTADDQRIPFMLSSKRQYLPPTRAGDGGAGGLRAKVGAGVEGQGMAGEHLPPHLLSSKRKYLPPSPSDAVLSSKAQSTDSVQGAHSEHLPPLLLSSKHVYLPPAPEDQELTTAVLSSKSAQQGVEQAAGTEHYPPHLLSSKHMYLPPTPARATDAPSPQEGQEVDAPGDDGTEQNLPPHMLSSKRTYLPPAPFALSSKQRLLSPGAHSLDPADAASQGDDVQPDASTQPLPPHMLSSKYRLVPSPMAEAPVDEQQSSPQPVRSPQPGHSPLPAAPSKLSSKFWANAGSDHATGVETAGQLLSALQWSSRLRLSGADADLASLVLVGGQPTTDADVQYLVTPSLLGIVPSQPNDSTSAAHAPAEGGWAAGVGGPGQMLGKAANVSGVFLPRDGYWNANPWSEQVHACLHCQRRALSAALAGRWMQDAGAGGPGGPGDSTGGCRYRGRLQVLYNFVVSLERGAGRYNPAQYEELVCGTTASGTSGPLCGSCAAGWARDPAKGGCLLCDEAAHHAARGWILAGGWVAWVLLKASALVPIAALVWLAKRASGTPAKGIGAAGPASGGARRGRSSTMSGGQGGSHDGGARPSSPSSSGSDTAPLVATAALATSFATPTAHQRLSAVTRHSVDIDSATASRTVPTSILQHRSSRHADRPAAANRQIEGSSAWPGPRHRMASDFQGTIGRNSFGSAMGSYGDTSTQYGTSPPDELSGFGFRTAPADPGSFAMQLSEIRKAREGMLSEIRENGNTDSEQTPGAASCTSGGEEDGARQGRRQSIPIGTSNLGPGFAANRAGGSGSGGDHGERRRPRRSLGTRGHGAGGTAPGKAPDALEEGSESDAEDSVGVMVGSWSGSRTPWQAHFGGAGDVHAGDKPRRQSHAEAKLRRAAVFEIAQGLTLDLGDTPAIKTRFSRDKEKQDREAKGDGMADRERSFTFDSQRKGSPTKPPMPSSASRLRSLLAHSPVSQDSPSFFSWGSSPSRGSKIQTPTQTKPLLTKTSAPPAAASLSKAYVSSCGKLLALLKVFINYVQLAWAFRLLSASPWALMDTLWPVRQQPASISVPAGTVAIPTAPLASLQCLLPADPGMPRALTEVLVDALVPLVLFLGIVTVLTLWAACAERPSVPITSPRSSGGPTGLGPATGVTAAAGAGAAAAPGMSHSGSMERSGTSASLSIAIGAGPAAGTGAPGLLSLPRSPSPERGGNGRSGSLAPGVDFATVCCGSGTDAAAMWRLLLLWAMALTFWFYLPCLLTALTLLSCTSLDVPSGAWNDAAMAAGLAAGPRWTLDTTVVCWEGKHAGMAHGLGIPTALLLGLALPLAVAVHLWYASGHLRHLGLFMQYGSLCGEYSEGVYWWEAVVMLRKVAVAALVALGGSTLTGGATYVAAPALQLLACLLVLTIAAAAHAHWRPYRDRALHRLELTALAALLFSLASSSVVLLAAASTPTPTRHTSTLMAVAVLAANLATVFTFVWACLCELHTLLVEYLLGAEHVKDRSKVLMPDLRRFVRSTLPPPLSFLTPVVSGPLWLFCRLGSWAKSVSGAAEAHAHNA